MTTVAPLPGDVIEDYEILEKIGGHMGLVFKARHRLLDRIVALKLLPAEWITDPARLARFQRELRVMGQLEHPNLVTAADARVVGCWHLVAMELIEGIDLQRLVQNQGPLPVAAACEAARQAALGLQSAHEHGLIHRDIKPSNLMLTRAGTIKVIDMGLALIKEETTQLTQPGLVLGTMSYCPPEQFRDPSRVDIRADIYSLGCTLYHLLAGKPPYSQRTTIAEVMQAHLHEPFPSLAEVRPDAPANLESVLARMTAKEPGSRYATPDQVAEALTPFANGADIKQLLPPPTKTSEGPGPATPSRRPERATAPAVVVSPVVLPASKTPAAPRARRSAVGGGPRESRPWKQMAAASVLLLAIAAAVFLAINFRQREPIVPEGAPVVVLMDTTARNGVYDDDNKNTGGNNAQELTKILVPKLLHHDLVLHPMPLSSDWAREDHVIKLRPDLVIIHRSSFFHSYNAVFNFGSTDEFAHAADDPLWRYLYSFLGDERLILLMTIIGNEVPQTRFLVYSRGTDANWLNEDFRSDWVSRIETRSPKLKGRIFTMVIPNKYKGTFRDKETAKQMRQRVKDILQLPEKRD